MAPTSGFDLLLKRSAASQGGVAAAHTTTGAGEQPAPETIPAPVPLTEAEIRKLVRAKMAAVLIAHPKLLLAQAGKSEADGLVSLCWQAFQSVAIPNTDDDKTVGNYIAECQERHASYMDARAKAIEPQQNLLDAEAAWAIASFELQTVLDDHQSRDDVNAQDYFQAANNLWFYTTKVKVAGTSAPETLPEDFVLPQADKALVVALRAKTFALAKVIGAINAAAPGVVAAVSAFWKNYSTVVKPPSRPTEEEIQRYLMQMERLFSDKLAINRRVISALGTNKMVITRVQNSHTTVTHHAPPGTRADLLERLEKALAEQEASIAPVQALSYWHLHPETRSAADCARAVRACAKPAQGLLGDGLDEGYVDNLDSTDIPTARPREARQIGELRKLMRGFAVAKAKHNEAVAALYAADISPQFMTLWNGVARARTWQEALDWHAGKVQEEETGNHKNASRAAKIELLKEQVQHLEADVENNIVSLERYVETIRPPQDDPACDEKRILRRAARIMCIRPKQDED